MAFKYLKEASFSMNPQEVSCGKCGFLSEKVECTETNDPYSILRLNGWSLEYKKQRKKKIWICPCCSQQYEASKNFHIGDIVRVKKIEVRDSMYKIIKGPYTNEALGTFLFELMSLNRDREKIEIPYKNLEIIDNCINSTVRKHIEL